MRHFSAIGAFFPSALPTGMPSLAPSLSPTSTAMSLNNAALVSGGSSTSSLVMITVIAVGTTALFVALAVSYYICFLRIPVIGKIKENGVAVCNSNAVGDPEENLAQDMVEWPETLFD